MLDSGTMQWYRSPHDDIRLLAVEHDCLIGMGTAAILALDTWLVPRTGFRVVRFLKICFFLAIFLYLKYRWFRMSVTHKLNILSRAKVWLRQKCNQQLQKIFILLRLINAPFCLMLNKIGCVLLFNIKCACCRSEINRLN